MVSMGCKPNVDTYITIIDILFEMGNKNFALKVLREMAFHRSILPRSSSATYRSLLHGLRILSREDDISKMLKDMEDQGVYVDIRTFNIFVDAYCKEGRMEDAESLVKLMIHRRIGPSLLTYKRLIEGYCLQGKMIKAMEVLGSMKYRGVVVYPDVSIFNILLNGYCKVLRNSYDSMGVFRFGHCSAYEKLFSKVPTPDECTFKIVLEGLCNNNRLEKAVSLFHSIGDKKLNSNIALYNILIGASKSRKFGIAKVLYSDLTTKGLQPNAMTYAAMINVFSEEGMVEKARELFLVMKEKGFLPNCDACKVLLQGFEKNRQFYLVRTLLQDGCR